MSIWHITDDDEGIDDVDLRVALNKIALGGYDIRYLPRSPNFHKAWWSVIKTSETNSKEYLVISSSYSLLGVLKDLGKE